MTDRIEEFAKMAYEAARYHQPWVMWELLPKDVQNHWRRSACSLYASIMTEAAGVAKAKAAEHNGDDEWDEAAEETALSIATALHAKAKEPSDEPR